MGGDLRALRFWTKTRSLNLDPLHQVVTDICLKTTSPKTARMGCGAQETFRGCADICIGHFCPLNDQETCLKVIFSLKKGERLGQFASNTFALSMIRKPVSRSYFFSLYHHTSLTSDKDNQLSDHLPPGQIIKLHCNPLSYKSQMQSI